jgi:hypothetical protein
MVPGARIELATPAFSGRRSTNELPRHSWSFTILGSLAMRVNSAGAGARHNDEVNARAECSGPLTAEF